MNDTTVIGAAGQVEDVRAYVLAVRAWLGDLPADEVEDLTAGMEADLAERAAESGGPLGGLLGQPEAYAAELRSAAGLPRASRWWCRMPCRTEPWTDRLARDAHELVARHPWLRELRPTWWLARGAVAGWVLAAVLGTGRTVLLPLVGAALSMWLGLVLRRREPLGSGACGRRWGSATRSPSCCCCRCWRPTRPGRPGFSDEAATRRPGYPSQVVANGEPVQNLYAYDAAGNRLDGVRAVRPVGARPRRQPRPAAGRQQPRRCRSAPRTGCRTSRADVFPLAWPGHDPWQDSGVGWTPPLTLPPVAGAAAATPAPTSSAEPVASPRRAPSPSPSPSAAPSASSTP